MQVAEKITVEPFGNRRIAIRGVGYLFYKHGLSVPVMVAKLKSQGIEVSLLHLADECMYYGWSAHETIERLTNNYRDYGGDIRELHNLDAFCTASYDMQDAMILAYLYTGEKVNWLVRV